MIFVVDLKKRNDGEVGFLKIKCLKRAYFAKQKLDTP